MLRHLVRLLLVASWAVGAVLAAQDVEARSSALPLEHSAAVRVVEAGQEKSATEIRSAVLSLTQQEGFLAGQIVESRRDNRGGRTIYLVGPGAESLVEKQPPVDFGSGMHTSFGLMNQIEAHTVVGSWVAYGAESNSEALVTTLQAQGATASLERLPSFPQLKLYSTVPWVVGLVLATSSAALVVSRTRRHAIGRLHGVSPVGAWLGEMRPMIAVWAVSGGLTLLGSAGWSLMRYSGVGLAELAMQVGLYGCCFFGFALLATLASLLAVYATDLLAALKEELSARGIIAVSFLLRAAAVFLALSSLTQVASIAAEVANRNESLAVMSRLGDANLVLLGRAYNEEAQNRLGEVVNSWLHEMDTKGSVLLAVDDYFQGQNALVVSETYLEKQDLLLVNGEAAAEAVNANTVTVLIPAEQWPGEDAYLLPELRDWLSFHCNCDEPPVEILRIEQGQRVAMFGLPDEAGPRDSTFMLNPIVAVMPPQFLHDYISPASQGRVFILDAPAALAEVEQDLELSRFVLSVTPVETRAAHYATRAALELREAVFVAVMTAVVALLAGVSMVVSYGKLRGSRIFVRYLHGKPAWQSYRPLLLGELILGALLVVQIPLETARLRAEYDAMAAIGNLNLKPPSLTLLDLLPALSLILVVSGALWATLAWAHRRVIERGVSEA